MMSTNTNFMKDQTDAHISSLHRSSRFLIIRQILVDIRVFMMLHK